MNGIVSKREKNIYKYFNQDTFSPSLSGRQGENLSIFMIGDQNRLEDRGGKFAPANYVLFVDKNSAVTKKKYIFYIY